LNEFVGWTVTSDRPGSKKRQATPDSPEFGDWKNPDVIGYRPRESLNSKVIETLALEVKREFSRAAIAQAESYKEFDNYVALAVYQPYEELLRHSILIQEAVSKGIGVLGIEMLGGNLTWRPIVAPKFLDLRETVIHAVMEEYFPESIVGYNQNQQAGTPHN
jgi:hypothetical protein